MWNARHHTTKCKDHRTSFFLMNTRASTVSVLMSLVFAANVVAYSPTDLVAKLREAGYGGDLGIENIAHYITAQTPEKRKELLDTLVQTVRHELDTPANKSESNSRVLEACASILKAVSNDGAILAAFGSGLNRVGTGCDEAAIDALSSCSDPKAVEVMTDFARFRFKQIKPWLPEPPPTITDDQKRVINDEALSFLYAVKGLASSRNDSGKAIAQTLRDEFVKLYDGSPHREEILRGLETDCGIDPLLREAAQHPPPSLPSSKRSQHSESEKPEPGTQPSRNEGVSSIGTAVAAVVASVVVLGSLIWFLRRK